MKTIAVGLPASPVVILVVAALMAALIVLLTGSSADRGGAVSASPSPAPPTVGSTDCRAFTATPTVSPTPTPSPPWVPSHFQIICNDTNQSVNDLHILISREVDNPEPVGFGLTGCPSPTWVYEGAAPPAYTSVALFWPDACVDIGEYVFVALYANCTTHAFPSPPATPVPGPTCSIPRITCAYWTYNSVAVTPLATAINPPVCSSPTYTATPVPTDTLTWGDWNCSGEADPVDSLFTLRFDAGLSTNTDNCPDMGAPVDLLIASALTWGDIDCSGAANPIDALKLLRFDAGLSTTKEQGCPDIGSEVLVAQ